MTTATQAGAEERSTQDQAKAVADDAAGKAGEVASRAADDAKSLITDAKGEALAVAGDVKEKARDLASDARQQLRQQAAEQAGRVAGAMRELSGQLSTMAGAVDGGLAPDLARQASSSIDDLARRLDDGGLDGLVADVKRFARNKPGTFLLGAAAAGMVAGRLTRSVDTGALADAVKANDDDMAPSGLASPQPPLDLTTPPAPVPDPVATAPIPATTVGDLERPFGAPEH